MNMGGATEYLVQLANGLADRGHRVVVASSGGPLGDRLSARTRHDTSLSLQPGGGRMRNVARLTRSALHLRHIIRRERIDVVNTHSRLASLAATAATSMSAVPVVSTMHELPARGRWITRASLGERVVAPSDYLKRELMDRYGVRDERVQVIRFGMSAPSVPSEDERKRLRHEFGLPGGCLIACVARMVALKGQRYLIEALPPILREHPDTRVVLIGDGPDRHLLEARSRQLGLADHVLFLGERRDVMRLTAAMDISVLPSSREILPLVVVEAMALGLPVVASAVGGIPEAVRPGTTGFLVPAHDASALGRALDTLVADPSRARRMGVAARARFEREFTYERWIDTTESALEQVVGSGGRS